MNKERRQEIRKAISKLQDVNLLIEDLKNEEEYAFDAMPESLQESKRGEAMQDAIYELEEAEGAIDTAVHSLERSICG